MDKHRIANVVRRNKTVAEVVVDSGDKKTVYFREGSRVRRKGPAAPMNIYIRVRSIFNESRPILSAKPDLPRESKKRLKPAVYRLTDYELKRFSILNKAGIRYLERGWIEITRWEYKNNSLHITRQTVIDLPAARRMQDHILDRYWKGSNEKAGEISRQEWLEKTLINIHDRLIAWREHNKPAAETQMEIFRIIDSLELCRNLHKQDIHDRLTDIIGLRDILDRLNPPAMAAQLVPVIKSGKKRRGEISIIVPHIALRRELLRLEDRYMRSEVKNALMKIKQMRAKSITELSRDLSATRIKIERAMYNLYRLKASPYFEAGQFCINELGKIKADLAAGRNDNLKKDLSIVRHVLSNELPM